MSSNDQRIKPALFKMNDFPLSQQADNQLAGKSLTHMQILGYRCKKRPGYVISTHISLSGLLVLYLC